MWHFRFIGFLILLSCSTVRPAENQTAVGDDFSPEKMKSLVKPLGEGRFQIDQVRFSKPKREVSFPAKVNLRDVLIEYAVVGKIGKLHEALLSTEVPPTHIHIAMLLLGTKNLRPKSQERRMPPGQPIDVLLSWEADGETKQARLEDWIITEESQRPISRGMWVYSGARIEDGYFTANTNESIIGIILDIDALVNNPRTGNENDEIWFPNESAIPPVGTPVTVTLKMLDTYQVPGKTN